MNGKPPVSRLWLIDSSHSMLTGGLLSVTRRVSPHSHLSAPPFDLSVYMLALTVFGPILRLTILLLPSTPADDLSEFPHSLSLPQLVVPLADSLVGEGEDAVVAEAEALFKIVSRGNKESCEVARLQRAIKANRTLRERWLTD